MGLLTVGIIIKKKKKKHVYVHMFNLPLVLILNSRKKSIYVPLFPRVFEADDTLLFLITSVHIWKKTNPTKLLPLPLLCYVNNVLCYVLLDFYRFYMYTFEGWLINICNDL